MDFLTALGVLRRHWVTCAIGVAITLGITIAAFTVIKPKYKTLADYLLILENQTLEISGKQVQVNPYLNFTGGQGVTSEVLIQWLNGSEAQRAVATAGGSGLYSANGFEGAAPLVQLQVVSSSEDAALTTNSVAAEALRAHLKAIQAEAGVPKKSQITIADAQVPVEASADRKSRIRAAVGALLAGFLITLFVVFAKERRSWVDDSVPTRAD